MIRGMITREAFTEAIEEAVLQRGRDYVYHPVETGRCRYHNAMTGAAECIIGLTADLMGLILAESAEGRSAKAVLYSETSDAILIAAAHVAQFLQDRLFTWGEALDAYHRVIRGGMDAYWQEMERASLTDRQRKWGQQMQYMDETQFFSSGNAYVTLYTEAIPEPVLPQPSMPAYAQKSLKWAYNAEPIKMTFAPQWKWDGLYLEKAKELVDA